METVVNGKTVVMREHFPAKKYWGLYGDIQAMLDPNVPFDTAARFLSQVIESWEFEGDPTKIESYENLDLSREFNPLLRAAYVALRSEAPKN